MPAPISPSLATKAEVHDDHLIINGQKIWTSYADEADWIFCLVRTSTAKKHTGISFVLFDMESPGVTTRPIVLISGKSPFCETFFDNVRVPRRNVVGELNAGWTIAKYLLTHEREMIGGIGERSNVKPLGEFAADAARPRRERPPVAKPRCARRSRASKSTRRRFAC